MAEIFEETKDMGVLIGKGGLYGQVGEVTRSICKVILEKVKHECTGCVGMLCNGKGIPGIHLGLVVAWSLNASGILLV